MPPRRPHPRSLDALYPLPKKKAGPSPRTVHRAVPKLCTAGHRQTTSWKHGSACSRCDQEEAERQRALLADDERGDWQRRLGPPPAVLEIEETSTGRVFRYAIPRHLTGRRRRR